MWDSLKNISHGRVYLRNSSLLATLIIVASFVLNVFSAPAAYAADAVRTGQSITYEGKTYGPVSPDTPLPTGVTNAYRTVDGSTVSFLIFKNGAPDTATDAEHVTYDFTSPGTYTNERPIPRTAVTIQSAPAASTSTCSSSAVGNLGWILCPVMNYLASMMDNIYKILQDFLVVRNIQSSPTSSLYKMWVIIRDIANVVFVVAFLIIIYSQITNLGISNYGIKKALPRVIIAAILVNISFWICAAAIDLSNFLGYAIYDMLMGVYKSMSGGTAAVNLSWASFTGLLLGGVPAAGAGVYFGVVMADGWAAAAKLLFPFIVGVVLAALVAVIIMAARQALVTVLVIISPLAFVAYVLPNTEKYFDKWKDLFLTMLLLFPIFSLIFSGAQLAGMAIIQNANGSAVTILFGLAVQVAPVVITPLLVKFSGSLLGRIAGIINNPKAGILDRTKNWARGSAAYSKSRVTSGHGRSPFAAGVRYFDRQKRTRDSEMKDNESYAQNTADIARHKRMRGNEKHLNRQVALRYTTAESQLQQAKNEVIYENARAGVATHGVSQKRAQQLQIASADTALAGMAKSMAERKQKEDIANDLQLSYSGAPLVIDGRALHEYAGGIMGERGINSVVASAKSTASKFMLDDIQNIQNTMDYDLAKDNGALHVKFTQSRTMAERVAYSNAMSKNGAPGIAELKRAFDEYDSDPRTPKSDLKDYKELMSMNDKIMGAGKDIEFWLTKAKDASGNERSFNDLTNDTRTWTNLSALAFAKQNAATHFHALNLLHNQSPDDYMGVIDMIRNNQSALGEVKQQVRQKYSIYSDDEIVAARKEGIQLPRPGTIV